MDYNNLYTQEADDLFKSLPSPESLGMPQHNRNFNCSQTIVEQDNKFIKIWFKPEIISKKNLEYYEKNYESIDEGIQDVIKLLNSVDDIIINYEWKPNYYLRLEQKKVDSYYHLHSEELLKQFEDIEHYIGYVRDNIKNRCEALYPYGFSDYHPGNIMIDIDLKWTNIDHDETIKYGAGRPVDWHKQFNRFAFNLKRHNFLTDYNINYLKDIWENK